jgi:Domain of unknown function (DUF3846)
MEEKIRVLYIPSDKEPVELSIDNTLEAEQKLVEGWIEPVLLYKYVYLYMNEEGIYKHLPVNRNASNLACGPIIGETFVSRIDVHGDNVSLTEEDIKILNHRMKEM